ncbi:MAG: hypothetical protein K2L99_05025, partial [Muribaculaceae bacterium]|nr:hypothetical protein [Muribaculaceae bacterium]
MTRFSILLISLICAIPALEARTIQGTVLSSNDSTAVAGANCLLKADGKTIGAANADANGAFLLETDNKSALTLDISMTGFSPTS